MADGKDNITRRDFVNGVMIAAGTWAVNRSFPSQVFTKTSNSGQCGDGLVGVPNALRGGNLPAAFLVGHWLRDQRLSYTNDAVKIEPGCDSFAGRYPILEDPQNFDVTIVGAGLSGLSTAFYLSRQKPDARILILDANHLPGGNAGRDDGDPLPFPCSSGGSYGVSPYADFQKDLYETIGLKWETYKIARPMYSYFFDDRTPGVNKGYRGWNIDTYGAGLKQVPYSAEIVKQLLATKAKILEWAKREGAPTDPADSSHPEHDPLSTISLHNYLVQTLGCDPLVSDFYTRYTIDALGGTAAQVNAHSSISFLGAEYGDLFALPGGNSGLARMILKWLIPESIEGKSDTEILHNPILGEKLDHKSNRVRIRQTAMAVRANDDGTVIYFKDGKFLRTRAKAVVLAGQSHTSQRLVGHLIGEERRQAWRKVHNVPVVVANVLVRSAAPFLDAGMGYNQYWWGSKYWADFVIADWTTVASAKTDRPTVLTFFGGNSAPPEELAAERIKLMHTPFSDYEKSIKEDLSRIMVGSNFDFDRDVRGIFIYRWGHGMIMPTPGSIFGLPKDGKINRHLGPRHLTKTPIGRISFAGQETEGTPSIESAISSGQRAAREVISRLTVV